MKKRILCLFLVLCLVLSMIALVACNDDEGEGEGDPSTDVGGKKGKVHATTDTSANVDPGIDRPIPEGATQPH